MRRLYVLHWCELFDLTNRLCTVEYADLTVIDLSKANTPEGFTELAIQARDGMREQGFIYVINHGITQEQVCILYNLLKRP